MKFTKPASEDGIYQRIVAVLLEAGYATTRADELPTSGIVVDEVCRRLRESDLVVIDTTGDSHSVSYEVGYCHGIARSPAGTILLRSSADGAIPFNYRHYRHRIYDSLSGLDRELRAVLGMSSPLPDDALTRHLSFTLASERSLTQAAVAKQLRRTLLKFGLSGRFEAYFDEGYLSSDHEFRPDTRASKTPHGTRVLRIAFAFEKWDLTLMHDFADIFIANMTDVFRDVQLEPRFSGDGVIAVAHRSLQRLLVWDVLDGAICKHLFPQSDPLMKRGRGAA